MTAPFKTAALTLAALIMTPILALAPTASTYATSAPASEQSIQVQSGKVLSFVPICSDARTSLAYWEVTNENTDPVTFTWNNVEHNQTGSFTAVNGTTGFTTYYDGTDPNNRTEFTEPNHDVPVSRNAKAEQCQPVEEPAPICVDGTNKANLVVTKLSQSSYSVVTKDNAPLCADVTLYLSSYTLPDNYDGTGFGGPTSYPQQIFDSKSAVLAKDTNGSTTLAVNLPDPCKNIQVDLYYAPEITTVGAGGHGGQFIAGEIYNKSVANCGGNGGETPTTPTEPSTPTTPAVTPNDTTTTTSGYVLGASDVASNVELPETGATTTPLATIMTALMLGVATYGGVFFAVNRKQN